MTTLDFVSGEAGRIVLIWLVNLVGLAAADRFALRVKLAPEAARKLIHLTAGCLAAPLPWVIRSNLSMVILAAGGLAALVACRRFGLLRSIHAVTRSSAGDLLFPIGIGLLFVVGKGEPMLYLIGLSFMVVSDAMAALVGRRYGLVSFAVERQRKSVEGSITFFVVSFFAAHLILLLGTDTPRLTSVLVAAQLALLVTCFEAISLEGNDNLLVPVVSLLIVIRLVDLPAAILGRDLAVQLALGLAMAVATWKWRFVGATGAVMLALFFYGAYALGGLLWVTAGLLVLVGYVGLRLLRWSGASPSDAQHQVIAVFYAVVVGATLYLTAAVVGMLGLGISASEAADLFVSPYLGVSAAEVTILTYTLFRPWDAALETIDPGFLPALVGIALFAPLSLFVPGGAAGVLVWIVAMPVVTLAIYRRMRRGSAWPRAVPWNWRLQAVSVATALLIVTPLLLALSFD